MAGQDPDPGSAAPKGTPVPLRSPRHRVPNLWLHMANLAPDVQALLVMADDDRVYLFPPEVSSLAPDLLGTDPAGLAQAGAGVEITMFFDAHRAADLAQAIARCRDGRRVDRGRRARRRRPEDAGDTRS
jgi:hypothetical protein